MEESSMLKKATIRIQNIDSYYLIALKSRILKAYQKISEEEILMKEDKEALQKICLHFITSFKTGRTYCMKLSSRSEISNCIEIMIDETEKSHLITLSEKFNKVMSSTVDSERILYKKKCQLPTYTEDLFDQEDMQFFDLIDKALSCISPQFHTFDPNVRIVKRKKQQFKTVEIIINKKQPSEKEPELELLC